MKQFPGLTRIEKYCNQKRFEARRKRAELTRHFQFIHLMNRRPQPLPPLQNPSPLSTGNHSATFKRRAAEIARDANVNSNSQYIVFPNVS
jgi:hypothetical protein